VSDMRLSSGCTIPQLILVAAVCVCSTVRGAAYALSSNDARDVNQLEAPVLLEIGAAAGLTCRKEVQAAKTKCGEELAHHRQLRADKCKQSDLANLLKTIKERHQQSKVLQVKLDTVESELRRAKKKEEAIVAAAHAAKQNLLASMVHKLKEQKSEAVESTTEQTNIRKIEDTQSKAHRATLDAVSFAESSPDMDTIHKEQAKAIALYKQLVEEKVAIARAKYQKQQEEKNIATTEKDVATVLDKAKTARDLEGDYLKQVKSATLDVADANLKLARNSLDVSELEQSAALRRQGDLEKAAAKQRSSDTNTADKLKIAKEKLAEEQAAQDRADAEVTKLDKLDIKQLLSSANEVLSPGSPSPPPPPPPPAPPPPPSSA